MELIEVKSLKECESIIEKGLSTFVDVGRALMKIRDDRLYRETHRTFEEYCKERWGMSRIHAHRLIEGAKVTEMLPIGNKPATESQARPLTRLPPAEQPMAFQKAVAAANQRNEKLTAKHVEEVVNEVRQSPEKFTSKKISTPLAKPKYENKEKHYLLLLSIEYHSLYTDLYNHIAALKRDDWPKEPKSAVLQSIEAIIKFINQ